MGGSDIEDVIEEMEYGTWKKGQYLNAKEDIPYRIM